MTVLAWYRVCFDRTTIERYTLVFGEVVVNELTWRKRKAGAVTLWESFPKRLYPASKRLPRRRLEIELFPELNLKR